MDAVLYALLNKVKKAMISKPPNDTEANYVPKTDGSGGITWAPESGGGGSTAEDITYDQSVQYSEGTVGIELKRKESINNKIVEFQDVPDDNHYPSEKLVKDSLDAKLDTQRKTSEAGYFLVVGNDGKITTASIEAWQGGSY